LIVPRMGVNLTSRKLCQIFDFCCLRTPKLGQSKRYSRIIFVLSGRLQAEKRSFSTQVINFLDVVEDRFPTPRTPLSNAIGLPAKLSKICNNTCPEKELWITDRFFGNDDSDRPGFALPLCLTRASTQFNPCHFGILCNQEVASEI